MPRILTIWLPRWPVQRRLLERPELRRVPVFVCRRERRGVMKVVSWAWATPPRAPHRVGLPAGNAATARIHAGRIHEGMSLAEGMAVLAAAHGSRACHVSEVDYDDPVADRAALEELARSCRRFAPIVALEQPPAGEASRPECLHVDVTGTADFFGGEGPLVRTAVWTLAVRGIHARAAIADTPAAAWAAAHHTDSLSADPSSAHLPMRGARHRRWALVPPGGQLRLLGPLPAAALGLGADVLAQLEGVGVGTIGGIARLPRKSLASRFDPQLSRRLTLFTGERSEPLAVPCSTELPTATHPFDVPLSLRDTTADDLAAILERLVEACLGPLAAAGKGVTALQVRLDRGQAIGLGEPSAPLVVDVGMFQPTSCVKHVVELVQLRMARLRLPREIAGITVDVVSAGQADCRQRTLFGEPAEASAAQVTMLLDRLSGRLGRRAVFEPLPLADAQPEHAWAAVPPMQATKRRAMPVPAPSSVRWRRGPQRHDGGVPAIAAAPQRRPLWMLPQPVRLESVVVAAAAEPCPTEQASAVVRPPAGFRLEGRMREVVKAHGPERIETAWWRGPTVRRDYYVVETSDGGRYWIFRRLGGSAGGSRRVGAERPAAQDGGAWFLHGMFS
jgi:protein ImuB